MSGLKSAWEISLEKSDKMVPEAKKKLGAGQKKAIGEIRKEYQARIADKELTLQHKLNKLAERVSPDRFEAEAQEMKKKFAEEKLSMEKEMESRVEAVYEQK